LRGRSYKSGWLLILFMFIGLIAGSWLGDIFQNFVPLLGYTKTIGLEPTTLRLSILTLNFGLLLRTNLAGVIGLILGIFVFIKL